MNILKAQLQFGNALVSNFQKFTNFSFHRTIVSEDTPTDTSKTRIISTSNVHIIRNNSFDLWFIWTKK